MGDVVHALPVVADLHRHQPGWVIDWLVEPPFAPIVELHPGVSRVHRLPWRKWRKALHRPSTWQALSALRQTLRDARYDAVLDLQGLIKSAVWARQAQAPVIGYDAASAREPWAAWCYHHRHAVSRQAQAVWRCRQLAALHFGYSIEERADFGLSGLTTQPTSPAPLHDHTEAGFNAAYGVLVPNASRPEKLWPDADWQAVGAALHERGLRPVVLWGSPAEHDMAQRIAQGCGAEVPGFLKVDEAARLLAGASVVVGLDTGFSHLAAALGRPVVGIYCDHEPGLAGLTGPGAVRCLGGKGLRPSRQAVLVALDEVYNSSICLAG